MSRVVDTGSGSARLGQPEACLCHPGSLISIMSARSSVLRHPAGPASKTWLGVLLTPELPGRACCQLACHVAAGKGVPRLALRVGICAQPLASVIPTPFS